jgi:uncharacterized membrane protein YvbJ
MALINCPECQKEISDKVKACPFCGYPFSEENDQSNTNQVQQVEVTGVKLNKGFNKRTLVIIGVLVGVVLIAFFGYRYYSEQKAQKLYEESFNTYVDNLNMLQLLSLAGGADAESLSNLTAKVWSNAIWEERDSETDKYTRPNGYFVEDFNAALANLYGASSTKTTVQDLEDNQTAIQSLMKELQNPPEGLETCYNTATELYTAYKGLTDLAINPSGSLNSFSESKNSKVTDFMDAYEKLNSQLPEKFPTASED